MEDVEFIKVQYEDEPKLLDIETFLKSAKNIDYDESWGGCEINKTLRIVGKDWWLKRANYDGYEWWEFKQKPKLYEDVELVENEEVMKRMILQKELEEND